MNYLKNLSISLAFIIIFILGLTFIGTLFNYIGLFNKTFIKIIKIIIPIISMFIGGFIFGKKQGKNGWLEGLKLSLIFVIMLSLFNYLGLNSNLTIKLIIYYIILIISTILGSIIGVNKFKPNEK